MKNHVEVRIFQPFGAQIYLHWSALLVATALLMGSIEAPVVGAVAVFSYLGIIVMHEIGHAWIASRQGCRVFRLEIGFIHGRCVYEMPYHEKSDQLIAWGGVLVQLTVAATVFLMAQFSPLEESQAGTTAVIFLGYFNLIIALFNLAPSPHLDGGKAWRYLKHLAPLFRLKSRKSPSANHLWRVK